MRRTASLIVRLGQHAADVAIAAGRAEAKTDTMALTIDATRATKGDAMLMLDAIVQALFRAPWPPVPTPSPGANELTYQGMPLTYQGVPLTYGVAA